MDYIPETATRSQTNTHNPTPDTTPATPYKVSVLYSIQPGTWYSKYREWTRIIKRRIRIRRKIRRRRRNKTTE